MSDDKIRDLGRIFAELVRAHGASAVLETLPQETYWALYLHFQEVQRAVNKP